MKKILLLLIVGFLSCTNQSNYNLVGTWDETDQKIECQDKEFEKELQESFTSKEKFNFRDKETFEWTYLGAKLNGTYTINGDEMILQFGEGESSRRRIVSFTDAQMILEHKDDRCTYTETFNLSK